MKRRKHKKQVRMVVILSVITLLFITTGYAAISTNITLKAKGNILSYDRTLATTYITNLYSNGDNTLIDDGTDNHNVRYSGKPVNNYVCLANEKPCSDDNLYRIIGVFNNIKTTEEGNGETRVKLVKATSIGEMQWDESGSNDWSRPATLNTFLNNLELVNNILIDNAVWNLGGNSSAGETTTQMYEYERGIITGNMNSAPSVWTSKISLIYPSDYGFASSACYQNKSLYKSDGDDYSIELCKKSNWLYKNQASWFLTPNANTWDNNYAFYICFSGAVCNYPNSVNSSSFAVFPSFYLKSNVNIIENGNDGSEDKPYILELSE